MKITNCGLIGMGAVGSVYSRLLYNKYKDNFFAIACNKRKDKIEHNGINVNDHIFFPKVYDCSKTQKPLDLVLIAVKNYSLDDAVKDLKNVIDKHTILLPLLNGVTSTGRLKKVFRDNIVFYGLSMGIDAVRNDDKIINTVDGTIQFGYDDNSTIKPEVSAVKEFLDAASINTAVFKDMKRMVWRKYVLNVGWNVVTALTGACYGDMLKTPYIKNLLEDSMMEVVNVAQALNIDITKKDVDEINSLMGNFSETGKTSMHQDMENKRISEIDSFSGTLIELGKTVNIPTPVNETLYKLVKSIEGLY